MCLQHSRRGLGSRDRFAISARRRGRLFQLGRFASAGALVWVAACATGGGQVAPRSDANWLTREELSQYPVVDVLNAIRRLRPRWLQARGVSAAMDPVPFLDGARLDDLDALRRILVDDVESIEYVNPSDATMRYGTGFPGGAIEVTGRVR
ncbi:MAG: hypothetical protein HKO53_05015 [Gemmatimonadetes bacterium]|nr:hypothetical protein [Gemmatimonadota bacterium]